MNTSEDQEQIVQPLSREEAIARGELIDVTNSPEGPQSRLKLPTALTRGVWNRFVEPIEGPCVRFRLWDILWHATLAIRQRSTERQIVHFRIPLRDPEGMRTPTTTTLKALYGYGDHGERTVTIALPEE